MNRLTIRSRLVLSFTIILVITGILGIVSIVTMRSMLSTNEEIFTYRVTPLYDLDDVNVYFNRMTSNLRQVYIARQSGDEDSYKTALKTFHENKDKALSVIKAYRSHLQSNPKGLREGEEMTNQVINNIEVTYMNLANKLLDLIEQNELEKAAEAFIAPETIQIATDVSGSILSLFNYNIEQALKSNDTTTEEARGTILLIALSLGLSLLVSLFLEISLIESIRVPINKLKNSLNEVANGNLDVNVNSNSRDEIGQLMRSTAQVIDTIHNLLDDIRGKTSEIKEKGNLDARITSSKFSGAYREVADGINNLTDSFTNDIYAILKSLSELADGNFNTTLVKMPGKKEIANRNFDKLKNNLKSISADIRLLVDDAAHGKLSSRAEDKKYKGDWAALLVELNNLLETIVAPINEAASVLQMVSNGNFDNKIIGEYQGDFLLIKDSINNTINNIASYINEISKVLNSLSENNLNQEISREYVGKFSEIRYAINNIIDKFNRILSEISVAAEQVATSSRQVAASSMNLAQGSTEQAASVEELNATVSIINETTNHNSKNAQTAQSISTNSKANAARGNEDMDNMLKSMQGIKESSNNISKIIKVINDIAFQTNLLALNASVEASHAGVHGRGFAIVAEEVRNLASKSQNAAKETEDLIDESIQRVSGGSSIATKTAEALHGIISNVDDVADIISEISTASEEQSSAIAQISDGLARITEVVQSNSATSEEAASASQELSNQAELLKNLVSVFILKKSGKYK